MTTASVEALYSNFKSVKVLLYFRMLRTLNGLQFNVKYNFEYLPLIKQISMPPAIYLRPIYSLIFRIGVPSEFWQPPVSSFQLFGGIQKTIYSITFILYYLSFAYQNSILRFSALAENHPYLIFVL